MASARGSSASDVGAQRHLGQEPVQVARRSGGPAGRAPRPRRGCRPRRGPRSPARDGGHRARPAAPPTGSWPSAGAARSSATISGTPVRRCEQVVRALLERQPGPGQGLAERGRPGRRCGTAPRCRPGSARRGRARRPGRCPASGTRRRRAARRSRRDPGRLGVLVGGLVRGDAALRPAAFGRHAALRTCRRGPGTRVAGADGGGRGRPRSGRLRPVAAGQLRVAAAGKSWPNRRKKPTSAAAEAVDRLIRVADHGQARPVPGQQPQQLVLGRVDVLVLIDADHRPAPAQRLGGVRARAREQGHGSSMRPSKSTRPRAASALTRDSRAAWSPAAAASRSRPACVGPGQLGGDGAAWPPRRPPGSRLAARPGRAARAGSAGPGRERW